MSTDAQSIEKLVDAWCSHDLKYALIPVDRDIIEATRALRALICEEAIARRQGREIFNAWARLGRMIGERGGSPTLMASTADGLFAALGDRAGDEARAIDIAHARVAIAEGFAAAVHDEARAEMLATWDPPHCIVRIDADTVAISAGFPDDDHDLLEAWAARVTQWVLSDKKRNAIVTGREAAARALIDALTLVGVTLVSPAASQAASPTSPAAAEASKPPHASAPEKRGSWLPWRRSR
jgi:hypothetical protein